MKLSKLQRKEWQKCKADPVYFCRKYVKIRHPKKGAIDFDMYGWQEYLVIRLKDGKNVVIAKVRQVGASWAVGGYILWLCMFHRNQEIQIFSIGERQAKSLLRKIKFMYRNLPKWMRIPVGENNMQRITFVVKRMDEHTGKEYISSVSSIDSLPSSPETGRGETPNFTFFDEHGAQPNDTEVWASVQPSLIHGGNCCSVSTPPRNLDKVWTEIYDKASSGLMDDWEAMFVTYQDCRMSDDQIEAFIAKNSVGMTPADIRREYRGEFYSGDAAVFDPSHLANIYKPIRHPNGKDGLFIEWKKLASIAGRQLYRDDFEVEYADLMEKIQAGKENYTGVDSSEGKGQDQNSVCTMNEFGIQIAADHNNLSLPQWAGYTDESGDEQPGFVTRWHRKFPGYLVVEENGPGMTVYNRLLPYDHGYTVSIKRAFDNQYHTGSRTRIINALVIGAAGKKYVITDPKTYEQMRRFQRNEKTGKMEAPKGTLDDAVLSLAWSYDCLLNYGIATYEVAGARTAGKRIFDYIEPGSVGSLQDITTIGYGPRTDIDQWPIENKFDLERIRSLR